MAATQAHHERGLDCDVVELGGQRFLGTPLWFAPSDDATRYRSALSDFTQIHDYDAWVYAENQRARRFFEAELRAGDVVVTHHLPVRLVIRGSTIARR